MTTLNDPLSIRDGHLYIEDCDAAELAREFGTPLFVVSERKLAENYHTYHDAFASRWPEGRVRVMGAIKANPVTAIRRVLTREGCGCDTFGMGELEVALRGGVPPEDIAVNGSIKSREVIRRAIELGIHVILDSPRELDYCEQEAQKLGKKADVILRLKPYLDDLGDEPSDFFPNRTIRDMTQTVKYGIPTSEMLPMVPLIKASQWVNLVGVHTHAGRHSKKAIFWQSLIRNLVALTKQISDGMGDNWSPHIVSVGGGFAAEHDLESRVAVTDYSSPTVDDYAETVLGNALTAGEIGETLMHYAAQRFDRVCLFAVHHGKISGWMSRGLPLDSEDIRSFSVFEDAPSIFWELEDRDRFVGPIPGSPVNDEIVKLLGVPEPSEVLVIPVPMAGHPKGYLLADNPVGGAVSQSVQTELEAAGRAAGEALAVVLRGRT